jgi:hypothetical protein
MGLSSEEIDQLSFNWDESVNKKNSNKAKITSSTEVHLEEYFAFLEDVAPFLPMSKKEVISERKVFEL